MQIFLSLPALCLGCGPKQKCLHTLHSAEMCLFAVLAFKFSVSMADMFGLHIPSGIRSLDPTSLFSSNIYILSEGLVSSASSFSASSTPV